MPREYSTIDRVHANKKARKENRKLKTRTPHLYIITKEFIPSVYAKKRGFFFIIVKLLFCVNAPLDLTKPTYYVYGIKKTTQGKFISPWYYPFSLNPLKSSLLVLDINRCRLNPLKSALLVLDITCFRWKPSSRHVAQRPIPQRLRMASAAWRQLGLGGRLHPVA